MSLKLSCIICLLVIAISLSGCVSTAELFTAIVHQRAGIGFKTYSSGNWTFEGLDTRFQPRVRSGFYSTTVSWTPLLDPNDLGKHSYCMGKSEKIGVVYTCKAGHIDIGHVRKMADWSGYLSVKTLEHIEKENTKFSFKLYEPSKYYVCITYPENWENYSEEEKENIAKDVSIKLGTYFSFNAAIWHEVLTWFDYKPKEILSDFESAFAWEDMYSNLLGILLAEKALRNEGNDFAASITSNLNDTLDDFGVQSRETTISVTNSVNGKWFSKKSHFPEIHIRNLDIGLDDGYITPCPVSGIAVCENSEIKSLKLPDWDISKYGFSVKLEIEPREWEKNKILKVVYPDKKNRKKNIEPSIHLPIIMNYIKNDAVKRGYLIPGDSKVLFGDAGKEISKTTNICDIKVISGNEDEITGEFYISGIASR